MRESVWKEGRSTRRTMCADVPKRSKLNPKRSQTHQDPGLLLDLRLGHHGSSLHRCWGFRGYDSGFRGYDAGFRGYEAGFRGHDAGLRGYDSGFRGLGVMIQGLGV